MLSSQGAADDTGRIPGHDGFRRNVANHDTASGDNGARSDGHSRSDEGLCRHPGAFRDVDGRGYQAEIRGVEVVRGGAQIGILGNDCSRSQLNPADAIAIDVVSRQLRSCMTRFHGAQTRARG